mgnify:CR=1 FL=1
MKKLFLISSFLLLSACGEPTLVLDVEYSTDEPELLNILETATENVIERMAFAIENQVPDIEVKNKGDKQLKDVKVTSTIQDLGVRAASGPFTIKKRSSASRLLFLDIPSDTEEDVYYLRTAVTSRKESNAKYRILEVNKVC